MALRNTLAHAAKHVAAQAALDAENATPDQKPALTQRAEEKAARAVSIGVTPDDITATTNLRRH